jgi:ArsR family transcriptional regulator
MPDLIPDLASPFAGAPLTRDQAQPLATILQVLADPARLQILSLLQSARGGELSVSDFVTPLGLSQPTVSHHLQLLERAGLVERRKHSVWVYYRLVPSVLAEVTAAIRPKARRR